MLNNWIQQTCCVGAFSSYAADQSGFTWNLWKVFVFLELLMKKQSFISQKFLFSIGLTAGIAWNRICNYLKSDFLKMGIDCRFYTILTKSDGFPILEWVEICWEKKSKCYKYKKMSKLYNPLAGMLGGNPIEVRLPGRESLEAGKPVQ